MKTHQCMQGAPYFFPFPLQLSGLRHAIIWLVGYIGSLLDLLPSRVKKYVASLMSSEQGLLEISNGMINTLHRLARHNPQWSSQIPQPYWSFRDCNGCTIVITRISPMHTAILNHMNCLLCMNLMDQSHRRFDRWRQSTYK